MSKTPLTLEEQVEILADKVADLELICALMFRRLASDDTLTIRTFANRMNSLAKAKGGPESIPVQPNAFSEVADFLVFGHVFENQRVT